MQDYYRRKLEQKFRARREILVQIVPIKIADILPVFQGLQNADMRKKIRREMK